MKEKDKVLQALCDGLGENYKLMEIDLELCIYRDFGNRFEVEVSGVHTAKQNKKATIYLWCMDATGAHCKELSSSDQCIEREDCRNAV